MPKLNLRTALRIRASSGEVYALRAVGFLWTRPVPPAMLNYITTLIGGANAEPGLTKEYLDGVISQDAGMSMLVGTPTHTTVASGNWSNPAIWNTGTVPAAGAIAQIEHAVTYDAVTPTGSYTRAQIETMRLDLPNLDANHALISPFAIRGIQVRPSGSMTWATSTDTFLLVDTIYEDATSRTVGTEASPILDSTTPSKPRAEIMFIGQHDPGPMMSLGWVSKNTKIRMWGEYKTPDVKMAAAAAGATSITLDSAPTNWKVGDDIVITGTVIPATTGTDTLYTGPSTYYGPRMNLYAQITGGSFIESQDEKRRITAIAGNVVSFATPLAFAHTVRTETLPNGTVKTLKPRAAMLSCSIQITGFCTHEKGTGSNRRGHTMDMFAGDIVRKNVRLLDLGRTRSDATLWIDGENDATTGIRATSTGAFLADTNNRRGRYPSHLHWTGWSFYARAVIDERLVIDSTPGVGFIPGWAYTQHNSRAHAKDVLVFRTRGAGMVTETGKEIGQWENCGVMFARSDGFGFQQFADRAEVIPNHNGHAGVAFENQSRQLLLRDCWGSTARIAAGWRQQKVAPFSERSPDDIALRMYCPITNNMSNTPGDHTYDSSLIGRYGHQQVEIPDLFNFEFLGCFSGISSDSRDNMDHSDVMPGVFKGNLILGETPYHIRQYSQNYINIDCVFWGDGTGQAVSLGTKTFGHSFSNCRAIGFSKFIYSDSLNFNGELVDITGDFTELEATNIQSIDTPDPLLHAQNDAYGFTLVDNTGPGGNARVLVRQHVAYTTATLPSPHPGLSYADPDPEPGLFPALRFYELTGQQHTQTISPLQSNNLNFKGLLIDGVGRRHWPSYARFNAPTSGGGDPKKDTRRNANSNGMQLVARNKWYQDGPDRKMRLWFYDADRRTGQQISIPYTVTLTGTWDEAFLAKYQVADANATLQTFYPAPLEGYGYSDTPVVETKVGPFVFADAIATGPSTITQAAAPILVSRISTGLTAPISTSAGGEYRINGGAWTATPGTVKRGDSVEYRATSGASAGVTVFTLTIGTESAGFAVTTPVGTVVSFSDSFTDTPGTALTARVGYELVSGDGAKLVINTGGSGLSQAAIAGTAVYRLPNIDRTDNFQIRHSAPTGGGIRIAIGPSGITGERLRVEKRSNSTAEVRYFDAANVATTWVFPNPNSNTIKLECIGNAFRILYNDVEQTRTSGPAQTFPALPAGSRIFITTSDDAARTNVFDNLYIGPS